MLREAFMLEGESCRWRQNLKKHNSNPHKTSTNPSFALEVDNLAFKK